MGYKISGTLTENSRVMIVNEADWSIESNTQETPSSFEVTTLTSGNKIVLARTSEGEITGFGSVAPIYF